MNIVRIACCAAVFLAVVQGQGYTPNEGFVPDKATAIRIAEAVLMPVYGEKQIESERPFKAILREGVWTVTGTLSCPDGKTMHCVGGVAAVQISKSDARIISMIHGK